MALVSKHPLRTVQGVSYPRSGHHLLVNCLLAYFGESPFFQRTDGHKPIPQLLGAWNFCYCDYYHHCLQVPCSHPATRFQKHHDYAHSWRDLPRNPDRHKNSPPEKPTIIMGSSLENLRKNREALWIVQYREAVPAIVSYYVLKNKAGLGFTEFDETKQNYVRYEDTEENWRDFAKASKRYWLRFMERWVGSPQPHSLLIEYDRLLYHPFEEVSRAIAFFDPSGSLNEDFLKTVIEAQDIQPKSSLKEFKYYDPVFFKELEDYQ